MSRFFFWGAPNDTELIGRALAAPGLQFMRNATSEGRPVLFEGWSSRVAELLDHADFLYIAGPFTVDIRTSGSGTFILQRSGPLLGCRMPHAYEGGWALRQFNKPPLARPVGRVEFRSGLLEVFPYYLFTAPPNSTRDFESEAKAAYRGLVKALKKVLVLHEGKWIGPQALEWARSGETIFH